MKNLFLIPARGGSKGLPKKNILPINNKPLIQYSIEFARSFSQDKDICLSTDSEEIIDVAQKCSLAVEFIRPSSLASDTSTSYDVILHALNHFSEKGLDYDTVTLLQPTSPLRKKEHFHNMMKMYSPEVEMVVSVNIAKQNPYYTLFEENQLTGYIEKSKNADFTRRQDVPQVYALNGSIYIMNVKSLQQYPPSKFTKVKKYVMEDIYGADIDTFLDFKWVEFLLQNNLFNHE